MTDEKLAAIISRADAAIAIIVSLLVEKGLISKNEFNFVLNRAIHLMDESPNGEIVSSIFKTMKNSISISDAENTQH